MVTIRRFTFYVISESNSRLRGFVSQCEARKKRGKRAVIRSEMCIVYTSISSILGWFQRILKSRVFSSEQNEHKEKRTENPVSSVSSFSPPSSLTSCPTSSSSPPGAPPSLNSLLRWSRKYDVFVCHSSVGSDCEEAWKLVSFLEALPRGLRCFLQHRDDCPGGATSTELCQAVQDSHLWVLLITPDFLQDDWCQYMMHQALAEGPMSNRIIPLYQNLSRAHYPKELKFFCCINLSQNPEKSYARINMTVITCEYRKSCVTIMTFNYPRWYRLILQHYCRKSLRRL